MTLEQTSVPVDAQKRPNGYNSPLESPADLCKCGVHRQHVLFRFLWNNPGVSLKTAAEELHLSYPNVRMIKTRLMRRSSLDRLCPECFRHSLQGLTCSNCGFEADRPNIPIEVSFKNQSPVHSIQPQNGLGTDTDYTKLGLSYGGRNIAHLVETSEDPLLERCKSLLWEILKGAVLSDQIVEEATRLLTKEVKEFEHKYSDLVRSTKLAKQLVKRVLYQVALRYPFMKRNVATIGSRLDISNGEKDE